MGGQQFKSEAIDAQNGWIDVCIAEIRVFWELERVVSGALMMRDEEVSESLLVASSKESRYVVSIYGILIDLL